MPQPRRTLVYGPAYLDRVLRVDRPLLDPATGETIDGSARCVGIEKSRGMSESLIVVHERGRFTVTPMPEKWPGPRGRLITDRKGEDVEARSSRMVRGIAWHDDLGGMGAGYASALGGALISALGSLDDPTSRTVEGLLNRERITHRLIRVPEQPADWTLLVTSGEHGDKLAIGFRGCHEAIRTLPEPEGPTPADLVVVAGLPNRLVAQALGCHHDAIRFLAPAMRNMIDRDPPLAALSNSIDLLSCNRREWETLADRESLAERLSLLAITDGPAGSRIRYRSLTGFEELHQPAVAREAPPRDTNRAGEAFASNLISTLLDEGWRPWTPVTSNLIRLAAARAAAAAAIVLDLEAFGFPSRDDIGEIVRTGVVANRLGPTSPHDRGYNQGSNAS